MPISADGYITFLGGMNSGLSPNLIANVQTRRNVNITLETKAIRPRPGKNELEFTFLNPKVGNQSPAIGSLTYREIFLFGRAQHAGRFQTESGEYLIQVKNGVIFATDEISQTIRVLDVIDRQKLLNYNVTRINGGQADRYYVLHDWPSNPVYILSDLTVRRTKFSREEMPRSSIGVYVHNRYFPASGTEFGASDPVSPDNPLAPISFKESIVSEDNPSPAFPDQFFRLTYIARQSEITAMGYLQQTAGTSPLGYGPLVVSTKEAIHIFGVDKPRATWENSQFGSAYIFNYGIVGARALANVGPDLFYKSTDGHIYSTGTLFSDQRQWGHTPISQEIKDDLLTRNTRLLVYSALGYFNNRLFVSLKPFVVKARGLFGVPIEDYVSSGVGILEMNNASGLSGKTPPIWASIYSGLYTDFVEINGRFLLLGKTPDGKRNTIQRLEPKKSYDSYRGIKSLIRSRIYTRTLVFNSDINEKDLQNVILSAKDVLGKLNIRVYYLIDNSPDWTYFGGLCYSAPQWRRGIVDGENIAKIESDNGSKFRNIQFRLDIEGEDYEITDFKVLADVTPDYIPQRKYETPEDCGANFEKIGDIDL